MSESNVATRTTQDIIGKRTAGKAIEEIFNVIHPAPPKTALRDIFTPETASQFLERVGNFSRLLSETDSHADALKKLDAEIAKLEGVRDQVLAEL